MNNTVSNRHVKITHPTKIITPPAVLCCKKIFFSKKSDFGFVPLDCF